MVWHKFRKTLKMRTGLLLFCYIYALKALNTGIVQSPGSLKVEDGGTVSLQCRFDIVGMHCYTVVWTKIHPWTNKLIFPEKTTTGTSDGPGTACLFTFKKAKVEDSGTYYCSVVFNAMTYFGSGSTVIVAQENRTEPPAVDILWPRSSTQPRIPLLCVVSGVVPSEVRVFWLIDGEEDSGLTESLWTKDNGQVVVSTQNQVLVPVDEWERGAVCTCVVQFAGKNITKIIQNQANRDVCVVLLYGALAGAGLTIIVVICIAVFLYHGRSVRSDGGAWEQRRTTGLEHRHHSGRQGRGSPIDPNIPEVQYASLEEASLARRT